MADDSRNNNNNSKTSGLQQHFQNVNPIEQTGVWDQVWQKQITPWDRSAPSPALIDMLNDQADVLVPGCGRGYDVLLFASYGYDAYGLDVSRTAVEAARVLAREQGEDQSKYPLRDDRVGRGNASFILGDFFNNDFLSEVGDAGPFDIVYDYTFICALPPDLRPAWAKRMTELLKPTGHMICLEFPLHKAPALGGPPHGLSSSLYKQLLAQPGQSVRYDENGKVHEDSNGDLAGNALVRVMHWAPTRTHEVGKGTDRVSIWQPRTR